MKMRWFLSLFSTLFALLMLIHVNAFAEEEVLQCQHCGEDIPNYSNFCLYCGYTVQDSAHTDVFAFSDPKIVPAEKEGIYRLDFIFTCLYPKEVGKEYPSTFNINYSLLDAEHVAIKTCSLQVAQLSYGDKVRASACPHFKAGDCAISQEQFEEAKYVKFIGCDPRGAKSITFESQQIFPLDTDGLAATLAETSNNENQLVTISSKPKTVIKENAYAQIAIEDFEITEVKKDSFYFKVKIRNITDSDIDLSLRYLVLNRNQDILSSQLIGTTTNPAAGQAIWAGPYKVSPLDKDAIYICFVSSDYVDGMLKEEVLYPLGD